MPGGGLPGRAGGGRGAPASRRPAILDRMAGRRERLTGEVIAAGQSELDLCIMAERLKDGLGADMLPGAGGIDCVEA